MGAAVGVQMAGMLWVGRVDVVAAAVARDFPDPIAFADLLTTNAWWALVWVWICL